MVVFSLDLETIIIILVVILCISTIVVAKSMINSKRIYKSNHPMIDDSSLIKPTGRYKHVITTQGYVLHAEYEDFNRNIHWRLANEEDMKLYDIMHQ